MFEIYAYGNVDALHGIFNAVAMIMNSADFSSMIRVAVLIGFAAGGPLDLYTRILAQDLSASLGQPVVVMNQPGVNGSLAANNVARAAPDGYTFFMGAVHHTIAPSMYPKLDYDIEKSFVPVALVSSVPQVIVVNPQRVAANDLKGFIEAAKKADGKMNYGSAGNGSSHHLAGELFNGLAGTKIAHVPYKGAGPALQDLAGGQIGMMFVDFATARSITSASLADMVDHYPSYLAASRVATTSLAGGAVDAPVRAAYSAILAG